MNREWISDEDYPKVAMRERPDIVAETMAIEITTLIKKQIAAEHVISGMHINDVSGEYLADQFYFRMKAWVLSEKTQDIKINVPSTWWDAFKNEKFPDWAKKKWPPGFVIHHIVVDAVLPKFSRALPEEEYNYVVGYNFLPNEKYYFEKEQPR